MFYDKGITLLKMLNSWQKHGKNNTHWQPKFPEWRQSENTTLKSKISDHKINQEKSEGFYIKSTKEIDKNFKPSSIKPPLLEYLRNKHTFTASKNLSAWVELTNQKTGINPQKQPKIDQLWVIIKII